MSGTVTHNHGVKSQLARLLAMENISIQHRPEIKTAMFDPANRVLYLPVWREMSNDLYDLLVVHEVGHALDTPAGGWFDSIKSIAKNVTGRTSDRACAAAKGFLNVIEDARIDKRQKRRYPGSRRNYIAGYKELVDRNFFGTKNRDIDKMSFIDRANIYFKAGVATGIKFTPAEQAFIDRIGETETFDEVVSLTEEIFAYYYEKQDEQEMPQPQDSDESDEENEDEDEEGEGSSGDGDDDEEGSEEKESKSKSKSPKKDKEKKESKSKSKSSKEDGDDEEDSGDSDEEGSEGESDEGSDAQESNDLGGGDDGSEGEDDGEGDGESQGSAGDDSDDDSEPQGDIADSSGQKGGHDEGSKKKERTDDDLPEAETANTWEEKSRDLVLSTNVDYIYLNVPKPDLNYIVTDYKKVLSSVTAEVTSRYRQEWISAVNAEVMAWKTAENSTISFLVKEFETRKAADNYSKIQIAKTGVLNSNKLHSYRFNDDIFKRNTVVPTGKNHGFVMFLDWSSSMSDNFRQTIKQLFTLVLFCKRIQVPFEVYSFRDLNEFEGGLTYGQWSYPKHDHKSPKSKAWEWRNGSLGFNNFKLQNILSSRMTGAELNKMMGFLWNVHCMDKTERMSGTPLNEALAAAPQIVNEFRKKTRVQVTNVIVLTDGGGNAVDQAHGFKDRSFKDTHFFLEDEVLKKNFDLGKAQDGEIRQINYSADGVKLTTALLIRLKELTGCNLIGFDLSSSTFDSEFTKFYGRGVSAEVKKKAEVIWDEAGYIVADNAGYDQNFVISAKFLAKKEVKLAVNGNMTNKQIFRNFNAVAESKKSSRVFLRQFIERIVA